MKTALFRLILVVGVIAVALSLDYALGFVNFSAELREASGKFRKEAAPLGLRTRHLVPNLDHRYPSGRDRADSAYRRFRTDAHGTVVGPDAPKEALKRILFLGGSTTETNEVDEEYRFPYLVGKLLSDATGEQVRGVNLGVRGNTSYDSLNLLLNHPAGERRDIVVLMHNINDRLYLAQRHSYRTWLNEAGPTSWRAVTESFGQSVSASWDFLSHSSNALFLIRYKVLAKNPWTGEAAGVQVDERAIDFPDESPEASKASFAQSLTLYVVAARVLGKTPVLMTQPLGRASRDQAAFNDVVRDVSANQNVLVIDLDKELPGERSWLFLSDLIHLNNEGSQAVAQLIAARLGSAFFSVTSKEPRVSPIGSLDFSRCRRASSSGQLFKPGLPHELLKVDGRYPVFSPDERYLAFQQWNQEREVIKLVDLATDRMITLSEGTNMSDRHPTFFHNERGLSLVFARGACASRDSGATPCGGIPIPPASMG